MFNSITKEEAFNEIEEFLYTLANCDLVELYEEALDCGYTDVKPNPHNTYLHLDKSERDPYLADFVKDNCIDDVVEYVFYEYPQYKDFGRLDDLVKELHDQIIYESY